MRKYLSAANRRSRQRRRYAISTSMTRSRNTPSSRRGGDVERQAQAAQERAGADFSIVASKDSGKADVASISKDKPVELNQYNVQAYKKTLHTVEMSPDIDSGRGVAEVGYTISRKVSRDGKYLGVGAPYNFDSNKAYAKMTYTW